MKEVSAEVAPIPCIWLYICIELYMGVCLCERVENLAKIH